MDYLGLRGIIRIFILEIERKDVHLNDWIILDCGELFFINCNWGDNLHIQRQHRQLPEKHVLEAHMAI